MELFRRYMHLVGTTTPDDLAAWLDVQRDEIDTAWNLLAGELSACKVAGTPQWALTADIETLTNAGPVSGVHLLPPHDPFLLGTRAFLLPERAHQRQLWRAQANPGAIFVAGEIVGTWRQRTRDGRLHITFHPFHRMNTGVKEDLARRAEELADLRSARDVTTTWNPVNGKT